MRSILWDFLDESSRIRDSFMLYAPDGPRPCHMAQIPESFNAYLSVFRHKKRYNLKRQVRLLRQFSDGNLNLRRIQATDDVMTLWQAMKRLGIVPKSDQDDSVLHHTEILDLAGRGMLLSYVLTTGEGPCALALGTKFKDTLLLHKFAHDLSCEHLSPGAVLHLLMMEDLISNQLAKRIDYGFGEPKYRMNNFVEERVSVMLFRRTIAHKTSILVHSAFEASVNRIKSLKSARVVTLPIDSPATP